ncbi:LPP20 family lipoprotein [Candidatus Neomarinimicrobiota bacterium]
MKRMMAFTIIGILAIVSAGCAGGGLQSGSTEARESDDIPAWALTPPREEGMIYGVGQAKQQNPSLARRVAAQRAREEVATSVESQVQALIRDYLQNSGVGERAEALEFSQAVSKGVTDATLTGAMIREAYIAQDGTYFILVEYSLDQARMQAMETARQEEALWNEFKANQGFDELERELEKLR